MKKFKREIDLFIKDYAKSIIAGNASMFIGAGLSRAAGYLGWTDLLRDKAIEIGLDVEKEKNDLISLAQYYINQKQRFHIDDTIRNFFASKPGINPTSTHMLLSALPIKSYWTTNYDRLLEKTFELRRISYRAQYSDKNLALSTDNTQVIIHKMHGDVESPDSAVIAKEDYERYDETHEMMLAKFKGEMCSNTFLFLGYSFNDPNIHHILARIRKIYDKNARQHYCIMKRVSEMEEGKPTEDYDYKIIKQNHQIDDFKNYGINVILVDDHSEILDILSEIRRRVYIKNVLISGAYEDDTLNKDILDRFSTTLSTWLIERGFHIFSGFGKNLGGTVVKGAFDGCTLGGGKEFNKYVRLFPFPYNVEMSEEERIRLYTHLRENMIANTQITILICGEKKNKNNNTIQSPGVIEEFNISRKQGNLIIPIAISGGAAKFIWTELKSSGYDFIPASDFDMLNQSWDNYDKIFATVQKIINTYTA